MGSQIRASPSNAKFCQNIDTDCAFRTSRRLPEAFQEALLVVDDERKVAGFVERDYILGKMMLAITAPR